MKKNQNSVQTNELFKHVDEYIIMKQFHIEFDWWKVNARLDIKLDQDTDWIFQNQMSTVI